MALPRQCRAVRAFFLSCPAPAGFFGRCEHHRWRSHPSPLLRLWRRRTPAGISPGVTLGPLLSERLGSELRGVAALWREQQGQVLVSWVDGPTTDTVAHELATLLPGTISQRVDAEAGRPVTLITGGDLRFRLHRSLSSEWTRWAVLDAVGVTGDQIVELSSLGRALAGSRDEPDFFARQRAERRALAPILSYFEHYLPSGRDGVVAELAAAVFLGDAAACAADCIERLHSLGDPTSLRAVLSALA